MRTLVRFFTEQPLFSNLLTIVVIGVGIASMFLIRKEVFPNVSYDIVTVVTPFPGSSATEVEQLITNDLERDTKEIEGIKKMTSTSIEGRSVIVIELDPDTITEEEFKSDLRDVVDNFKAKLPAGAEEPIINSLESKQQPVIEVALYGEVPPLTLRNLAKTLEEKLEDLFGTAIPKIFEAVITFRKRGCH